MLRTRSVFACLMLLIAAGLRADERVDGRWARAVRAIGSFGEKAPSAAIDLYGRSRCVIVVPRFRIGDLDEMGRGFASCRRDADSKWSLPVAVKVTGGGMIWDIAGTRMDVVVLVDSPDAIRAMSGARVLLGVDVDDYPGPLSSDVTKRRERGAFGYSISDDGFEPLALGGGIVTTDNGATAEIYAENLRAADLLNGTAHPEKAPQGARDFVAALGRTAKPALAQAGS